MADVQKALARLVAKERAERGERPSLRDFPHNEFHIDSLLARTGRRTPSLPSKQCTNCTWGGNDLRPDAACPYCLGTGRYHYVRGKLTAGYGPDEQA